MTRPPDMLRFIGGPVGKLELGWTGPWPPPETLRVAYGRETKSATVVAEHLDPFDERLLASSPTIVVTRYRRRNASSLPDDLDVPGVFRGAEYVPDGDDA